MLKNHITKEEALARIRDVWQPSPGTEEIPLEQCDGRIAAEDCVANVSLPVVRAAGMDGICVNFNLLENGIPDASGWERGREYDRADTGDDFDDRYDTVLPIEWIHPVDCQEGRDSADSREEREASAGPCEEGIGNGHGLRIVPVPVHGPGRHRNHTGRPDEPELYRGMNVRPSGSLIEEGTLLIRAGMRITPLDIAALATGGYRRPDRKSVV